MLKGISSNAYVLELPQDLEISPIFNVEDLTTYHGPNDVTKDARGFTIATL